jgi:hypothetical protein
MKWSDELGVNNVVKYQFSGMEVLWDFVSQKIDSVPVQESDPNSLLNYFKSLTATKRSKDYPTYGWVEWAGEIAGENTCQMMLKDGTRTVVVALNNNDYAVDFSYMGAQSVVGKSANSSGSGSNYSVGAHGFLVVKV